MKRTEHKPIQVSFFSGRSQLQLKATPADAEVAEDVEGVVRPLCYPDNIVLGARWPNGENSPPAPDRVVKHQVITG